MFKNNSYSLEACNYSFREDEPEKENSSLSANYAKKDMLLVKL